jgi:hypothetical protein
MNEENFFNSMEGILRLHRPLFPLQVYIWAMADMGAEAGDHYYEVATFLEACLLELHP